MPQPPQSGGELQISTLVIQNITAFVGLISTLEDNKTQRSIASSHLARFKLWAANLGAHRASGGRSLEYRLRDSSFIRNHIVSLLQDLDRAINEGTSAAEGTNIPVGKIENTGPLEDELAEYFQDNEQTESETDQILGEIGHVIDCLLRLSMTIRNPAPHDQFKSRVGVGTIEIFEKWYTKHVLEKFVQVDTKMAERLGRAMARRRQYFQYREDHSNRLAEGLEEGELDHDAQATTIASSLPEHLKESPGSAVKEFVSLDDSQSEISRTSYAPSIANSDQIRVPPIPKEYIDGPFKCPFCHMIVSIDTRHNWKKHVFRDLRPYICLSEVCKTPDQQFSRRTDWSTHMRREHWITWHCSFGCPGDLHSANDFRKHTKMSHGQEVSPDKMDILESLSTDPDLSKAEGTCLFCLDFQITSTQQYDSHIGGHLEQLALFTLPTQGYGDRDEDNVSNEDVHSHSENSSGRDDDESVEGGKMAAQQYEPDNLPGVKVELPPLSGRSGAVYSQTIEQQTRQNELRNSDLRSDSDSRLDENDPLIEPTEIRSDSPAREADNSRSYRPSLVDPSNPRHSSGTLDYGEDGYTYTTAGDLVRYDLDHPQSTRSRRPESLDRGYRRPDFNDDIYPPSVSVDSRPTHYRGPPPSTRGLDKITRANENSLDILLATGSRREQGESKGAEKNNEKDLHVTRDKITSGLGTRSLKGDEAVILEPIPYETTNNEEAKPWEDSRTLSELKPIRESSHPSQSTKDSKLTEEPRGREVTVSISEKEKPVRVVSAPRDKTEGKPLKGILKVPKASFPEDLNPIREGVQLLKEDKKIKETPPGARWTRVNRRIINPEALTIGKERFEVRDDFIIILRVLSKEEIQTYAAATEILRERRRQDEDRNRYQNRYHDEGSDRNRDDDERRRPRHRRYRHEDGDE